MPDFLFLVLIFCLCLDKPIGSLQNWPPQNA